MKILFIILFLCFTGNVPILGQTQVSTLSSIHLDEIKPHTRNHLWLQMITNDLSQPVTIPVIILKGNSTHPVLGLTAAIHGNELNGIAVIHRVLDRIRPDSLEGTIIAVPGLNAVSIPLHQREYSDLEDLNRIFPGKANGNPSQQYVWAITQKILSQVDYLIDMHTASFGRENTLYVRADLDDEKIARLAFLQDADIILKSSGAPSTQTSSSEARTLRAEAMGNGIPALTVEYGNPQVFQEEMIRRGERGVMNVLRSLGMVRDTVEGTKPAVVCRKSYWIYTDRGGFLEVPVQLNQHLRKGEVIAILKNPFGEVIQTYYCPEDGIVIGKSSNPAAMNGGRILHLGILDESNR